MDLTLVDTQTLVTELMSRCDAGVISWCTVLKSDGSQSNVRYAQKGDALKCLGLCQFASGHITAGLLGSPT